MTMRPRYQPSILVNRASSNHRTKRPYVHTRANQLRSSPRTNGKFGCQGPAGSCSNQRLPVLICVCNILSLQCLKLLTLLHSTLCNRSWRLKRRGLRVPIKTIKKTFPCIRSGISLRIQKRLPSRNHHPPTHAHYTQQKIQT